MGKQVDTSRTLQRIAFGSCNKHNEPQPAWARIRARAPDLWVWLGDIVYGDAPVWIPGNRVPASLDTLRRFYGLQKAAPEYREFVEQVAALGVYDDHDFGARGVTHGFDSRTRHPREALEHCNMYGSDRAGTNDVDNTFDAEVRAGVPDVLLDFFDEPVDTERRRRAQRGEGVFESWVFGSKPNRVKLILLDNRTNRDPYYDARGGQDMLGPAQWAWLETQLTSDRTEITIIATGLQLLTRSDPWLLENWSLLPQSQARLLSLLAKTRTTGTFLLSGDVHYAELNRLTGAAVGYPLYELTSSGLTHSLSGPVRKAMLDMVLMGASRVGDVYGGRNWGEVDIAWASRPCGDQEVTCSAGESVVDVDRTNITLRVWGIEDNSVHIQRMIPLAELQPKGPILETTDVALAFPFLPNGRWTPSIEFARNWTLQDAIAECASGGHGYSAACDRVMMSFEPGLSYGNSLHFVLGHFVLLTVLVTLLAGVGIAFSSALGWGPTFPGGRMAAGVAAAAVLGMLFQVFEPVL